MWYVFLIRQLMKLWAIKLGLIKLWLKWLTWIMVRFSLEDICRNQDQFSSEHQLCRIKCIGITKDSAVLDIFFPWIVQEIKAEIVGLLKFLYRIFILSIYLCFCSCVYWTILRFVYRARIRVKILHCTAFTDEVVYCTQTIKIT